MIEKKENILENSFLWNHVVKDMLKDLLPSDDNFASIKGRMGLETQTNTGPEIRSQKWELQGEVHTVKGISIEAKVYTGKKNTRSNFHPEEIVTKGQDHVRVHLNLMTYCKMHEIFM